MKVLPSKVTLMSSIRCRCNAWAFHGLTITLLSMFCGSRMYSTLALLYTNGTVFFIVYIKFIAYHFTSVFCLLHHRVQRSSPTFNFGRELLVNTIWFAFEKLSILENVCQIIIIQKACYYRAVLIILIIFCLWARFLRSLKHNKLNL